MSGDKSGPIKIIFLISFLDLVIVGLTVPLLGLHLKSLGASHLTIGILSSLYSLIQIFIGPLIGSWSDVRGRKSVLLITLSFCAILYAAVGLSNSVIFVFAIRCTIGVFKHVQSLCKAVVADILPAEQQAGAFAKIAAFSTMGFLVGPSLGGHLYELPNGFAIVGFISSLLCVTNICLVLSLQQNATKKPTPNQSQLDVSIRKEFLRAIRDIIDLDWNIYWQSFLLKFLFGCSINMYFENQAWLLKERFQLSQRYIGYIISFFSAIGTASALLIDHISNQFYKDDTDCTKRLLHSFVVMSSSMVLLYLSTNIYPYLLFLIPTSISVSALRVVSLEHTFKQSKDTNRGSLSGASHSTISLARSITPFVTGVLCESCGTQITLLLCSVPSIVGAVFSYNMMNHKLLKRD